MSKTESFLERTAHLTIKQETPNTKSKKENDELQGLSYIVISVLTLSYFVHEWTAA